MLVLAATDQVPKYEARRTLNVSRKEKRVITQTTAKRNALRRISSEARHFRRVRVDFAGTSTVTWSNFGVLDDVVYNNHDGSIW